MAGGADGLQFEEGEGMKLNAEAHCQPDAQRDGMHILSLGAGVQSSTLALMAAHGEVTGYPHLTAAVFADTQDEPQSVYKWLDWLEAEIQRCPHPFPVHRVTKGRLSKEAVKMRTTKDGRDYTRTVVPFFTVQPDGSTGKVMGRFCTVDYKVKPVLSHVRQIAGIKRGQKEVGVVQWIGISLDEIQRMKESREPWAKNAWPLIDMRMKRSDCKEWMKRKGYPEPPRSSCVYCPFHNNDEWRRLKTEEPEEFQKAVEFERRLQGSKESVDDIAGTPFLHRSMKPLDEIDFRNDIDRGQGVLDFGFNNECEGMCGV